MVYISKKEMKNNEFIILRESICRGTKDINKLLEKEFSSDKKIINKKKDNKVDKVQSKVPGNKYNY